MKIGILGGTFNPPHNAHIRMAAEALEKAGMDKVILMPNGDPPHKAVTVSAQDRLRMTRLAAEEAERAIGSGRLFVSDIEISRPGYSFLVNTIEELKKIYPEDRLYFLAGGDAVMSMASWYGASRIFELADIVAFKRSGGLSGNIDSALRYLERRGARVMLMDCALPEISSSKIREMILGGADVSAMLPQIVYEYIKKNQLYIS